MTQWTSQQLKCLEAIGVPVYSHVPLTASTTTAPQAAEDTTSVASVPQQHNAEDTTPVVTAPQQQSAEAPAVQSPAPDSTTAYYKLGPWVLEFPGTIPVESYDWLRDLAAYCQSSPTQVSRSEKTVSIKKFARNQLSTSDKKELWHLLKTNL